MGKPAVPPTIVANTQCEFMLHRGEPKQQRCCLMQPSLVREGAATGRPMMVCNLCLMTRAFTTAPDRRSGNDRRVGET